MGIFLTLRLQHWINNHCPIPETNIIVMNEKEFVEWCDLAMVKK